LDVKSETVAKAPASRRYLWMALLLIWLLITVINYHHH
jgi:hypothetical protein